MEAQRFIWMDGALVPWASANVHFLTHSLHYGTAVFEGIRFYDTPRGPAIFRLSEHLQRLYNSASVFNMTIPFGPDELTQAIIGIIRANELKEGYIRPLIYLGDKMGLNPVGAPVHCGIAVWPWDKYLAKAAVDTIISKYIRVHPNSGNMAAKISGVYYNSALASIEANQAGVDEAILLDYEGNVAEGPGENIFIVVREKNGEVVITPPAGAILPGITRDSVIRLLGDLKIILGAHDLEVREEKFTPDRLKSANEAFFTGTAVEITGIRQVDGVTIGNGGVGTLTFLLKYFYQEIVRGQIENYEHWLTYVE